MKYVKFIRHKISPFFKNINLFTHKIYKFYNNIDISRFDPRKISKFFNPNRYNFAKGFDFTKVKLLSFNLLYPLGFSLLLLFIYLNIPIFYNFENSKIEKFICKNFTSSCSIKGTIKYKSFPTPRLIVTKLKIEDFTNKNKNLGEFEKIIIRISPFELLSKDKLKFKKIELTKAKININLENLSKYKNFLEKKFDVSKNFVIKGDINFYQDKKLIAVIQNANLKNFKKNNTQEVNIKGNFLSDNIYINFKNTKKNNKPVKKLVVKLLDSQIYIKLDFFDFDDKKEGIKGHALFKQGQNGLSGNFNYKNGRVNIEKSKLKNIFSEGEIFGKLEFYPYFAFDLVVDLKSFNFNRLFLILSNLDENEQKSLFQINDKINGRINLSADRVNSKSNIIKSYESRIKFENGSIFIEQFLFNLGKLGAADIIGTISTKKNITKFHFENNIFVDNLRYLSRKLGIYNDKKDPANIFVSGNFDLINLNLRLNEISTENKMKNEDLIYIENEFNELMFSKGYESFFNFYNFKEFIKLVTEETVN